MRIKLIVVETGTLVFQLLQKANVTYSLDSATRNLRLLSLEDNHDSYISPRQGMWKKHNVRVTNASSSTTISSTYVSH